MTRAYTTSTILQNAAVTTAVGTILDITGMAVVSVQVTIAATATITFEASVGSGTMTALPATNLATGAVGATATATGIYLINCAGLSQFQARISAWSSGAVTAVAMASSEASAALAGSLGSSGTAITSPLDRKADAASVSVAFSTEDVALFATLYGRFVAAATLANTTTVPSTTIVGAVPMAYDGTTLAMQIATQEGTLLASAVRAATNSTADQTNYTAKGVIIWWNMTNVPSVDTVTLTITGKDPISGNYVTMLTSTATATTGQRGYFLYPGASTSSFSAIAGASLPRTWRVTMTHSSNTNFTYSVGYTLLP